jgi:hypothetical protein
VDSGVEINVISHLLAKELGLPIDSSSPMTTGTGFDSGQNRFLGVVRDLEVKVLDAIVKIHAFVIKTFNLKYLIILGCPY